MRSSDVLVDTDCVTEVDAVRRYVEAINESWAEWEQLAAVPPLFTAVLGWKAFTAAVRCELPPAAVWSVVHLEHDLTIRKPVALGQCVTTEAAVQEVRPTPLGGLVCVRLTSRTGSETVATAFSSVLIRGFHAAQRRGQSPPGHRLPPRAVRRAAGITTIRIDPDLPARYAAASKDRMSVHLDHEAAIAAGFPGIILQGLCTLAMCASAVSMNIADRHPHEIRRVAARFTNALLPGSQLIARAYRAQGLPHDELVFEALGQGRRVLTDGVLSFRSEGDL